MIMKMKQEFWLKIINGEKTIELRKTEKLAKLNIFKINMFDKKGRFNIPLYDENNNEKLGTITINGYSIIKNPFTDGNDLLWEFDAKNYKWINKHFNWLKEYFKDETEILVLKIESWIKISRNKEK